VLDNLGRILIWVGAGVLVLGLLLILASKIPGLGRLPGDLLVKRDNLIVYIPLGTMIVLSLVLTLILNIVIRLRR
jgi:hypothetical protein